MQTQTKKMRIPLTTSVKNKKNPYILVHACDVLAQIFQAVFYLLIDQKDKPQNRVKINYFLLHTKYR